MRARKLAAGIIGYAQEWNALHNDASMASWLLTHQQLGAITLPNNPADGDTVTVTINGTGIAVRIKNSIASANDVKRGASATATAANIWAFLLNPGLTNSNQIAASAANQILIQYVQWSYNSATTITPCSLNRTIYSPLTSFTASTTTAGNAYTAQTMQLFVGPGTIYVNGTRVLFLGGSTPTVTAPSVNPRIDVLTIDSSGTLAWTTGAENASPTAPAYPTNKIALFEIYNLVGETALYDNANQQTSQGYILNDVRETLQYAQNPTAFASDLIPDGNATRNLGSSGDPWNSFYAANINATTSIKLNGVNAAISKFGGTGSDGALSVSSGTTNIDCGGSAYFEKNYSSISITGTGKVAFINPAAGGTFIALKSQGGITITSSTADALSAAGMGGAGGPTATIGTTGYCLDTLNHYGSLGQNGASGGNGGAANSTLLTINNTLYYTLTALALGEKRVRLFCGSGGGGGGTGQAANSGAGGAGGNGGGALYIECGGAWNFTSTNGISISGANGSNGANGTGGQGGGGGGGGSVGSLLVLYTSLTANSGTIHNVGGTGGSGGTGAAGGVAGGGGGGAISESGTSGAGANGGGGTGGNGGNGTLGGGGGGGGGSTNGTPSSGGTSTADTYPPYLITQNNIFS